jgi:capsular polysaccharide transport system permease protein
MQLSFRQQWSVWRTVVFALYLRELQSKFNDKLGLGWAFVEPFLFIFALSFLRGLLSSEDVHSVPVFVFMMVGMVGIQSLMSAINGIATSIGRNRPLYAFRQVQPMSAVLTATLLELIIKLGVIALLLISLYLTDKQFVPHDPLLLIVLFVVLWLFIFACGLITAVLEAIIPEVAKLRSLAMRPLFFISCVFFSLQDIPQEFWPWLTWNPMVHFIELARYACYASYGSMGVSLQYCLFSCLTFLLIGLSAYRVHWKRLLVK